ncbi:methionyl-tRNA formyltransferase [Aestuariimicrobium ganziense]|uniref:methionyl-tRNA formyltransferase n=1 Tax=Aestuariimicrobium ganziense TaxID=2773677 RepID=UPI001942A068|nr:methionyl-tRNA formyltransferase [Aestuariimicrobium ganziense]
MRIAFAGTPDVAVPALDALVASSHDVVAVVSRPDAAVGRSKKLVPSPVAARAAELGLVVLKPTHPREEWFAEELESLHVEAVAVVAYGALLPQSVLDVVPRGWINLHFSLLPRWRGAAPVQHAIWAGDSVTGATTFRIVKALDAGPVYDMLELPLTGDETSGEVLKALSLSGADLLVSTLDRIARGQEPTPQTDEGLTLAPKISVDDARIDWSRPAVEVSRQIRAMTPAPGAWSLLDDQRFKVLGIESADLCDDGLAPGELLATKRALFVGTGDGQLELVRVQAFGKQPMAGADWARGVRLVAGTRLT